MTEEDNIEVKYIKNNREKGQTTRSKQLNDDKEGKVKKGNLVRRLFKAPYVGCSRAAPQYIIWFMLDNERSFS